MAILGTSGHDCADRTMRLSARIPDLDIWSQGQVRRISCGGRSAPKDGRRLSTRKPSLLRPNRAKRQWSRRLRLQRWSQRTFLPFGSLPIAPSGAERQERRRKAPERARATASESTKKPSTEMGGLIAPTQTGHQVVPKTSLFTEATFRLLATGSAWTGVHRGSTIFVQMLV